MQMANKIYRVIQWATGKVGTIALRHFIENPTFELAGVLVTDTSKAGKDAGEIAGTPLTGILATDDVEAIVATPADCVHFAPAHQNIEMVCRLLRSGKNVVSALGPFYPTERCRADVEAIEAACREGGTSFHGFGIHPGFAGDILPLTLVRIMERVDHIHIYEVVDQLANPSNYIKIMGFGRECQELLASPSRQPEAPYFFAQSMALVAESLGRTIDDLTTKLEVASAQKDIPYPHGVVKAGTVAGQHYEWTGWSQGKPLITYHFYWKMGSEDLSESWDCGENGYRIVIEGNPPMEVRIPQPKTTEGGVRYISLWTAMAGVNAIRSVCEAPPGFVSHRELGVLGPLGLIRTKSEAERGPDISPELQP
jgi:2,4-diaminopentanoate dehydrogenase